jgi:hypothetical protein
MLNIFTDGWRGLFKTIQLSVVFGGLIVVFASSCHAAPVCLFGGVRCFIACGHPPELKDAEAARPYLKADSGTDPYDRITGLDRWSALFTTPLGKCLGINGWKRYHFRVSATGKVVQAVTSWDGLRTIDLQLEQFNGAPPGCREEVCYVRAEVVRHVWKRLDHVPVEGERIRIEGELHWDGHGFLEIHPERTIDVERASAGIHQN